MEELSIINKTKEILDNFGQASILYATAEFSPFTNQKKPDLQFVTKGNSIYFIEYKINNKNKFDIAFAQSIIEHYKFVSEDISFKVFYGFATDTVIDDEIINFLSKNEITVFTSIKTPEVLSTAIIEWSKSSLV